MSLGIHYDLLSSTKLWHDDVRLPPRCHDCQGTGHLASGEPPFERCPMCGGWGTDWLWARTNDVAKEYLETGRVTVISLDHDLGGHDLDPNDPDVIYYKGDAEDNGFKLVDWMIENDRVPDLVIVHSWNSHCAEQMCKVLMRARERGLLSNTPSIHRQPFEVKP